MMNSMKAFDVKNVPLDGTNLVEASAGTGKTYSIAILVLRLIIEKNIAISHQLVVTFTKFAVAELQDRIRKLIKVAYDIASRRPEEDAMLKDSDDPTIRYICDKVADKTWLRNQLRAALLSMDEANILTIHGFCQQILKEFAFETKQHFQASLQSEIGDIVEEVCNEFWRAELSLLPPGLLANAELKAIREELADILKKGLNNIALRLGVKYHAEDFVDSTINQIQELATTTANAKDALWDFVLTNNIELKNEIDSVPRAKNSLSGILMANPKAFLGKIIADLSKESPSQFYGALESDFWQQVREYINDCKRLQACKKDLKLGLFHIGYKQYLPVLENKLEAANILTFDSLINSLHKAVVVENNETLATLIRNKFPAVFIDEFQDTDVVQFQLFNKLFIENPSTNMANTLFLIGDPKQSIYAFRNADVESYMQAAGKVQYRYSMNTNFRSSENMIAALNSFYEVQGNAAFGYDEEDIASGIEPISYQSVQAFHKQKKIFKNKVPLEDTLIFCAGNAKSDTEQALCQTIAHLLDPEQNYGINVDELNQRPLRPEDIAVLVRFNKDAHCIKKALHELGIPAVSVDEAKVLKSQEAQEMAIILTAMLQPEISNIKSALFLTFLHKVFKQQEKRVMPLLDLDEVSMIVRFNEYHNILMEQNAYIAFQRLFSDFSVPQILAQNHASQRILTNVMQIAELLHEQQYRKGLHPEEILLWLQKALLNEQLSGDEYTLQIESDENAVQLLSIHKSKGLEFPVVFVYGIHGTGRKGKNADIITLKEQDGTRYQTDFESATEGAKKGLQKRESQETRRLIYVALTRSVYQCYVFYANGSHSGFKSSELQTLIANIKEENGIKLNYAVPETSHAVKWQGQQSSPLRPITFEEAKAEMSRSNWHLHSFTALAVPHEYEIQPQSEQLVDYDHFIFNQLPRGASAGTKLHQLFEIVDFKKDYRNPGLVNNKERKWLEQFNLVEGQKEIDNSIYVAELIHHASNCIIASETGTFQLKAISQTQRLVELEFEFPLSQMQVEEQLWPLLAQYNTGIQDRYRQLKGMMTGFIDMLFEHEGKYYILDWKSNYLGYELENYNKEGIAAAMRSNQYTLQYLIYTLAVHKFLQSRLGEEYDYNKHFGGVIYLFLRGLRSDTDYGVFTDKPDGQFIAALEAAVYAGGVADIAS